MSANENPGEEERSLFGPARIHGLRVTRDIDGLVLELQLRGRDQGAATTFRFTGVEVLKVREDCLVLNQVVYLSSTDISSRRWEGLRFEVKDAEGSLSFYCAAIQS